MSPSLSILDLAAVGAAETVRDALEGTVALARLAERLGYRRIWYAEHHNIESIASSATAVVIAHVAAHTASIRLGAGGIMLPNHSPLVIAEQFGTLETLHPGRIDLGLGRAPGSDQLTMRALRRDPDAADTFPQDVLELQAFLSDRSRIPHVNAIPGRGTNVPLYILGSSLFGAQVAAALGLPFAFASHFAPQALHEAVEIYRTRFEPSADLDHPYVIAGVNVIAADTDAAAQQQLVAARRRRVRSVFSRDGEKLGDDDVDRILRSPQAAFVEQMMTYVAVGLPAVVRSYLDDFARHSHADELMVVHQADSVDARLQSVRLLAEAAGLPASSTNG
ncbi:MAG TPA: LLM class flavin-dependent oxidoreductase [Ilumatobacteraceae bacterium]|nr:LLM class flavin-dependent oxidoreductase [Ilumatobacteraceae bacterium]